MPVDFSRRIASALQLPVSGVRNVMNLLGEGATIPFIARYRKELTGSLDEVAIAEIRDLQQKFTELEKRRNSILESLEEQEVLTPELKQQVEAAESLPELEDIYLPYKPKKKTRAGMAKAKGLEPLAKIIMRQQKVNVFEEAEKFVNDDVHDAEAALAGARDIIAEWVAENRIARNRIRSLFKRAGIISSKLIKKKEEEATKYKNYFDWTEAAMKAPSHRILAMFRGENESLLRIKIEPPAEEALPMLEKIFVKSSNEAADQLLIAIEDAYKRLLAPSIENEIRGALKEKADVDAIGVFAENLRQLLLAPPLGQKNILAIDPGFRTGCKVVCLDRQGNLRHNETIFPHPPHRESKQGMNKIISLVDAYNIEAIAIGNGTAGRETENLIRRIRFKKDVTAVMVNENGASVYSASKIAREEFPEYDVTVRGAVSIGRRLMDPLAELVKIDPKSIGVGQYQHDVNQSLLQKSLQETVEICVNKVGVELNTASKELLTYVSGLGPSLAQNIVDYRKEKGVFESRNELKNVPRFGGKAFEQSAGFLRIRNAENILDTTAVHPESYQVVYKMAKKLGTDVKGMVYNDTLRSEIRPEEFVTEKTGLPTLKDIMQELDKPGRDPREEFEVFEFDADVNNIEDLKPGMKLPGIVTNITAFGAFVDLGVHQDGLIHKSQIADAFVSDPNDYLKINQKLMVKVVDVDVPRKRIQLSLRDVD